MILPKDFLKDTKIKLPERVSQRLDPNPTDCQWQELKVKVHIQNPHNMDELQQYAIEECALIPQKFVST